MSGLSSKAKVFRGMVFLNRLVMTPRVKALIEKGSKAEQIEAAEQVHNCLIRHSECDFGRLDEHDRAKNMEFVESIGKVGRVLSRYEPSLIGKIYIVTEPAEWGFTTTILTPEEY